MVFIITKCFQFLCDVKRCHELALASPLFHCRLSLQRNRDHPPNAKLIKADIAFFDAPFLFIVLSQTAACDVVTGNGGPFLLKENELSFPYVELVQGQKEKYSAWSWSAV